MNKEETLKMLDDLIKQFESMSEEELADYLWNNSETFKQEVIKLVKKELKNKN